MTAFAAALALFVAAPLVGRLVAWAVLAVADRAGVNPHALLFALWAVSVAAIYAACS